MSKSGLIMHLSYQNLIGISGDMGNGSLIRPEVSDEIFV